MGKDVDFKYVSKLVTDKFLAEQCYEENPEYEINSQGEKVRLPKHFFQIKYFGEYGIHKRAAIEHEGEEYLPITDDEVEEKVVILPSKAQEYKDEKELDDKIRKFIFKWLDVSEEFTYLAVHNIKLYWLYDRFQTINYLRALGDTGTGKSRFLCTFGFLSYKAILSSGASTFAPVFRMIEKWRGTLVSDEQDIQKSDESNEFVKLLNIGYEKNSKIMRCDNNDKEKVKFFDPYCPKIMATRRRFDDKATEARCTTAIMRQTARLDIKVNLDDDFYSESMEIRNMLLYYRLENYQKVDSGACNRPEILEKMNQYEPRLRQVNNPLVSLFANDENQLVKFFNFMDKQQKKIINERAESFDGYIVQAVADLFIEHRAKSNNNLEVCFGSHEINSKLKEMDHGGHDYNSRGIGKHLNVLGFDIKIKKVGGKAKRIIDWSQKDYKFIFERYLADKAQSKVIETLYNK